MRLLALYLLLFIPAFAVVTEGEFKLQINFQISGTGNGNIELLEYPQNYPGQIGTCTDVNFNFPPYTSSVTCDVSTYPSQNLDFKSYENSELTTSDSTITELANTLVEGESTRFEKAVAIAGWVRENIQYDLGVGDTQESGKWTYYKKVGTCDELSHLFITMARAAGLDARYSAGYAFDGENWLPHAWAEVWTKYGWTPIDIAFDEYGYVDGKHLSVNKGADGNHNFLAIYYFGEATVDHSFDISTKSTEKTNFILSSESLNTSGGLYTLVKVKLQNPFETPIAFFPKFLPPPNFNLEFVYPKKAIIVKPGNSTIYLVYKTPKVRQNYFYSIPLTTYLGPELVETSFTVSNNFECSSLKEVSPYRYDTSKCFDVGLGESANKTSTDGDFFCNLCYYHFDAPKSRSYKLDYPSFCESNCTLSVGVVGDGPYSVLVNSQSYIGLSDVYSEFVAPLNLGENLVEVDGVKRTIEVLSPPKFKLNKTLDGDKVCFESNWQVDAECLKLSCGENPITLNTQYDVVKKQRTFTVTRSCTFFEKFIDFLTNLTS